MVGMVSAFCLIVSGSKVEHDLTVGLGAAEQHVPLCRG